MRRTSPTRTNKTKGVECGTCAWRSQRVVIEGMTRCCNIMSKRHYLKARKDYDWCMYHEFEKVTEAAE